MSNYERRLDDYVDVAERIRQFRELHPEGSLQPANPAEPYQIVEVGGSTFIVYVAAAYRTPDDPRPGIGVAWEPIPGKTPYTRDSELMNAETSSWGRAIVAALAADTKKIATLDEVRARKDVDTAGHPSTEPHETRQDAPRATKPVSGSTDTVPATEGQERALYAMSKKLDKLPPAKGTLSKRQAHQMIEELQAEIDSRANGEEPF